MRKIILASTVPVSLSLFFRGLLRELSDEYEVAALSSPEPELEEVARREGVRSFGISMRRGIAPIHDLAALFRILSLFRRERPQMVHSITPKAGLLSMMAARIAGVPVRVHTFTGLMFPSSRGFRRRLLMTTDRITCRCATHVIAEGEGVRGDLLKYGITRKNVRVLGYGNLRGVDMEYYSRTAEVAERASALRASLGISDGGFVFVYAGRVVRDKGIDELAEAFCRLRSEGADVHLLLAGCMESGDPVSPRTEEIIASNEAIRFTARWMDDVRPWYAAADALVFPSHREGFPNAVLEAGAMELPSIVTDINGSREIIRDGETGIVIAAGDAEALYEAMKRMAGNRGRAAAMGIEARKAVAERWEQSFVRAKLKEFYREISI
ncbi:MAG: glycosyltransferase family 4 protein [Alistipes sp.]|nr:glycosyltransferase family 4 protein [Alistipes sp.]